MGLRLGFSGRLGVNLEEDRLPRTNHARPLASGFQKNILTAEILGSFSGGRD